jgi:pimeloyl-ACP methyl ester carboxylesterase
MDRAGPAPIFAGHREGGILAAKAAARAVENGRALGGLALISTGAPAAQVSQFKNTPPTIRRSFLGAHYARAAVVLGYKTAARIFHAGRAGEDKIVQYFYATALQTPISYPIHFFIKRRGTTSTTALPTMPRS